MDVDDGAPDSVFTRRREKIRSTMVENSRGFFLFLLADELYCLQVCAMFIHELFRKKINKHPIHCVRAMLVLQSSLVPPIESLQELGNGLMGLKL